MKIPFDIKYRPQIESGEYKVETGDKKRVRIICWNRKVNDFPIVALAYDAQRDIEIFINASVLGEPKTDIASERLFIITPEPELSEFEHAFGLAIVNAPEPEEKEKWYPYIKEKATELLNLARKELCEQIVDHTKEAYENGKAEALRGLPRWIPNRFDKHNFETCKAYLDTSRYLCYQDKMIDVSELVEKLPGFKEDEK